MPAIGVTVFPFLAADKNLAGLNCHIANRSNSADLVEWGCKGLPHRLWCGFAPILLVLGDPAIDRRWRVLAILRAVAVLYGVAEPKPLPAIVLAE